MNKKAFTLVEVMIIFVIVMLLLAIAIPSYYKARENSMIQRQRMEQQNKPKITDLEKGAPVKKDFTDADVELMIARHDAKLQREKAEKEKEIANMSPDRLEKIRQGAERAKERAEYEVKRLFEVEGYRVYSFRFYGENHFIWIPK